MIQVAETWVQCSNTTVLCVQNFACDKAMAKPAPVGVIELHLAVWLLLSAKVFMS